jgi:SpoVK/Ycf46/Vps4 family AAA+-type ATPase
MATPYLYQACRAQSNPKLETLAKKLSPMNTWNDLVLPEDRMAQLRELASHVKHKQLVMEEWGFAKKSARGTGLTTLFAGASGTGKTFAAEILGKELGLDLYKIDLSGVVSKYIGETEKNLNKIFTEAQDSNAILFFDEADALFGKRSEVKDAHDRYANIEVAYLLQKMEEHDGIVILATNLKKNMDDAFIRRMRFIIEFPFPDEKNREKLWQAVFPHEAKLSPQIDFRFLAKKLNITGGNIRNIALNAGFFAAELKSSEITMEAIKRAVRREFQKMGKLFTDKEFQGYRPRRENTIRVV